jgi:hypothetical protein
MKKENKTRTLNVRFTETEFDTLTKKFVQTTSSQLSHYVRNVLLDKPVVIRLRNESLDLLMEELILLKYELNAIGNNVNEATAKLYLLKSIPEFRSWLQENESIKQLLLENTNKIEEKIAQLSDKWLQE